MASGGIIFILGIIAIPGLILIAMILEHLFYKILKWRNNRK
jgi:hypothetical protein